MDTCWMSALTFFLGSATMSWVEDRLRFRFLVIFYGPFEADDNLKTLQAITGGDCRTQDFR